MLLKTYDQNSIDGASIYDTMLYNTTEIALGSPCPAVKNEKIQLIGNRDNQLVLVKEMIRGVKSPLFKGNLYDVTDHAYIARNLSDNHIIQWDLGSTFSYTNGETHNVFLGDPLNVEPPTYRPYDGLVVQKPFEEHSTFQTLDHVTSHLDYFEELSEIDYMKFIGIINLFFSLWNNILPARIHLIIDPRINRYNMSNIQYLKVFPRAFFEKLLHHFNMRVSLLTKLLSRTCKRYRRSLKILVGLDYFGSIIKLKDYDKQSESKITISMNDFINEVLLGIMYNNMYFNYPQETEFLLSDKENNTLITDAYSIYGDIS